MLPLILSGAVLSCGALLVLSGAAKLYRAARREDGGDSAIRAALHISPRRWRWIEPAAGLVEAAAGAAVCAAFHPVVAGVAMAAQGAIFTGLLGYARRVKAPGGCACVRRPKSQDAAITWPVQVRAAWVLAAGILGATARLPRLGPDVGGVVGALVGLCVFMLALAAEEPWHVPHCRFPVLRRPHRMARLLMQHGVFETMAASVGPFTGDFAYRREGCVDEFWFVATPRPGRADRRVAFRVSRPARGQEFAVEARIEVAAA